VAFSNALRELLSAAGVNKSGLARTLQLDRRVVGAIVEGREPCPESFLIRLHERDPGGLGRSQHLSALVELWSEASGSAPATLMRLMSPPGAARAGANEHRGVETGATPGDRPGPASTPVPPGPSVSDGLVDPGDHLVADSAPAASRPDKTRRKAILVGLVLAVLAAAAGLLIRETSSPSATPTVTRTIQIYNKVTSGMEMREDSVAFLSTKPANFCRRDGCVLGGTDVLRTGDTVPAVCQTMAARNTNGEDNNSADDQNPELFESRLWYGVRWRDGRFGFFSEVWVHPDDRGGLGLPLC